MKQVSFTSQAIDQLLNIIVNVGVLGSCGALCSYLPNKIEATVCNLLCDYVGIDEFVKIVEKYVFALVTFAWFSSTLFSCSRLRRSTPTHHRRCSCVCFCCRADLDPIYMCQLLKVCPIDDNGAASITSVSVEPTQGAQGDTFTIIMNFEVTNHTGTGEIAVQVNPPDAEPFGDAELNTGFAPGAYSVKFQLEAKPSEQEPFSPGHYGVEVALCNGECGSAHPHSKVFGIGRSNFTITA